MKQTVLLLLTLLLISCGVVQGPPVEQVAIATPTLAATEDHSGESTATLQPPTTQPTFVVVESADTPTPQPTPTAQTAVTTPPTATAMPANAQGEIVERPRGVIIGRLTTIHPTNGTASILELAAPDERVNQLQVDPAVKFVTDGHSVDLYPDEYTVLYQDGTPATLDALLPGQILQLAVLEGVMGQIDIAQQIVIRLEPNATIVQFPLGATETTLYGQVDYLAERVNVHRYTGIARVGQQLVAELMTDCEQYDMPPHATSGVRHSQSVRKTLDSTQFELIVRLPPLPPSEQCTDTAYKLYISITD